MDTDDGKNWEILLIEDSPSDVILIRRALDKALNHYRLNLAADGESALKILSSVETECCPRPDLIVMDLNLPRISGQKLLDYVRGSDRLAGIPVIVATSSDVPADRVNVSGHGAKYFHKSLSVAEFMSLGEL